jgi:hypothetical protein
MDSLKLVRKAKFLTRGIVSSMVFKLLYSGGFDPSKTLVILGSTRSGSTWLAELISSVDGVSQLFEPLNTTYVKQAGSAGITRNPFIKPDEPWETGVSFFNMVLSGRIINPWLASQISFAEALSTKRLVVKFVRANLLVGWMCKNLPILPPAMVIRHPCAVISSQIHKGWTPSLKVLLSNSYFDDYPEIRKQCERLKKPEELSALAWCLKYHCPLSLPKPYPFILICYERLVRYGIDELAELFEVWGLVITEEIVSQLNKPSKTVTGSSQVLAGRDPLAGWKNILSEDQVMNILSVLKIFEMEFYTGNLEPDYDKLNNFSTKP